MAEFNIAEQTNLSGEESAARGVLFLGDTNHGQLARRTPRLRLRVPDRHVLAATRSPGGELDQQHLLPAEVVKRDGLAVDRR